MGQYYKVIILSDNKIKKEIIRAWLCPYSYMNGSKLMEHSYIGNNYIQALEHLISPEGMFYMSRIVWAGDYADEEEDMTSNLYSICIDKPNLQLYPNSGDTTCYHYIINHTQKLYIDKEYIGQSDIHPLPLLLSEGNGRGGGDYDGNNIELCGTWVKNIISFEKEFPIDYDELICNFI